MSKKNTIKELAEKIADNKDEHDYKHIPIGADSDNVDRPNGETVEESLLKLESNQTATTIKPLKFTGGSDVTYDGSSEETVNIPSYTVFKGATDSANGNAGLVPPPTSGVQRKYLRDDGTWDVPDTNSYTAMKGATASANGTSGLVPAPSAGDITRYLRADATWGTLGAAAFANIVDNRTTTVKGFVPDATQLTEMQTQLDNLNSALESIDIRFLEVKGLLNAKYVIKGVFCMLITCNGLSGNAYATYLVQGYGATAARIHVTPLHAGSSFTHKILDTETGITINSTQQWDCSVIALYGELPTVTRL